MGKMKTKEFLRIVRSHYINDPFNVSGFAFWKIEKQIAKANNFRKSTLETGECLYSIINEKLIFYWSEKSSFIKIPMSELQEFELINIHGKYENAINKLKKTHNINEYFPYSYDVNFNENKRVNDSISIVTLNKENTSYWAEVVEIINESTKGNLTKQNILEWSEELTYCPELWIGAVDKITNRLVGVGISTYNVSVMETDLDWFYVRKDHQDRGVGTSLVQETISRCRENSKIIRVAGIANEFYEKCGFRQRDKWFYLTKKSTNVGWWD